MGVFINSYMWGSEEAPGLPYAIMVSFAVMGWIVIIPYYYYVRSTQKKKKGSKLTSHLQVMRFLDPEVIVDRVARLLVKEISQTVSKRFPPALSRQKVNQCILQLGKSDSFQVSGSF